MSSDDRLIGAVLLFVTILVVVILAGCSRIEGNLEMCVFNEVYFEDHVALYVAENDRNAAVDIAVNNGLLARYCED